MRKLLILILLLLPSLALADTGDPPQDVVTGISWRVHRNLSSIAISCDVKGDADTNAVVRLFYKRDTASAAYDSGMVMVRRPFNHGGGEAQYWATNFEGRLLNLAMGRRYKFYIEAREPDPVNATGTISYTTTPDTASTWQYLKVEIPGVYIPGGGSTGGGEEGDEGGGTGGATEVVTTKWYVDAVNGNDSNAGQEYASAFKTIGRAMTAMAASTNQGAGSSVLVFPGVYHESVLLNYGSIRAGDNRYLVGMSSDPDSVVLCGADEQIEGGFVTNQTRLSFSQIDDGIYAAYFPKDSCQVFVLGGERLQRKLSHTEMHNLTLDPTGWYLSNDTLYVRLKNGRNPNGLKLYAGARDIGIDIQRRGWRIVNMRVQYYGYSVPTEVSGADMNVVGYGVQLGVNGYASQTIIDNCKFIGNASYPLEINKRAGFGYYADSVLVTRCTFDGMYKGSYAAGKGRQEEQVTIEFFSQNSCFIGNNLYRMFNGVQPTYFQAAQVDSVIGSWTEVVNNKFKYIVDDAIEMDSWLTTNRLIMYNTIDSCGRAVSVVPINRGPEFVFYNLITNCEAGIKIGGESRAPLILYHNTIIGGKPIYNTGGPAWNITSRNNIYWGRKTTYTLDLQGSTPDISTVPTHDFNYDAFDSTLTTRMIRHNGTYLYSYKQFVYWTGKEKNGRQGPLLIPGMSRGDYRLYGTSPAVDTGCRIAGVNTSNRGDMYYIRPDIGRFESVPMKKVR
jgi:hypothetical protein